MGAKIFISHIHEEIELASLLERLLDNCFGGSVDVFKSSIDYGEDWLVKIRSEIQSSDIILTLFSPNSKDRPWINIETGYGVLQNKPTIPVCCLGLKKEQLPSIYGTRQGLDLLNTEDIKKLCEQIAALTEAKKMLVEVSIQLEKWENEVNEINEGLKEKYWSQDDIIFTPHEKIGSTNILKSARKRIWLDAVFYPYYARTGDQAFYHMMLKNYQDSEVQRSGSHVNTKSVIQKS